MKTRDIGFTLPVVLIISLALLTIGLSLTRSSSTIYQSFSSINYTRLANEAAEAGLVYATSCLEQSNYVQTWGSNVGKPELSPSTDCTGTTITSPATQPKYVVDQGQIKSTFSVGNLEVDNTGAKVIQASGTVYRTVGTSTNVVGATTYTSNRKQLINLQNPIASASFSGRFRTCGIITGKAWCWGVNEFGQLGLGESYVSTTNVYNEPHQVVQEVGKLLSKTVVKMGVGLNHTCMLTSNSEVYCTGQNNYGQLGLGYVSTTPNYLSTPQKVTGLDGKTITDLGTYEHTNCVIADGKIMCWGQNNAGQLGNSPSYPYIPSSTPVQVDATKLPANYSATSLANDGAFTTTPCAIVSGKAYCWGSSSVGQLGNGTIANSISEPVGSPPVDVTPYPVLVGGLLTGKTVTDIAVDGNRWNASDNTGYAHACAIADGKAYCWGSNFNGQIGDGTSGTANHRSSPTAVRANSGDLLYNKTIIDIAVGSRHSCALTSEKKMYCWGRQIVGQLGNGVTSSSNQTVPAAVSVLSGGLLGKTISVINGGGHRSCAIADYRVYCMGENSKGQLGDGTTTDRNVPTESIFLRNISPSFIF